MKRAILCGRWQPCHKAHEALIRTKLDEGIPVLILVRNVPPDDRNPYTQAQVAQLLGAAFVDELHDGSVRILLLPCDVEGIYCGRSVGYKFEELKLEYTYAHISGTEVRRAIRAGEDVSDYLSPMVHEVLKEWEL